MKMKKYKRHVLSRTKAIIDQQFQQHETIICVSVLNKRQQQLCKAVNWFTKSVGFRNDESLVALERVVGLGGN